MNSSAECKALGELGILLNGCDRSFSRLGKISIRYVI